MRLTCGLIFFKTPNIFKKIIDCLIFITLTYISVHIFMCFLGLPVNFRMDLVGNSLWSSDGRRNQTFSVRYFPEATIFLHKLTVICIIVCNNVQHVCYNSNLIVKFIFGLSSGHLKLKSLVIEVWFSSCSYLSQSGNKNISYFSIIEHRRCANSLLMISIISITFWM